MRAVIKSTLNFQCPLSELLLTVLPDFDPNHPAEATANQRFNRATLGVYEVGSTFKIFTTAIALETGVVDLSDGYDASRPLRVSRFTIRDFHPKSRWLSVPEIFMYSSNIGAAKMALDIAHFGYVMEIGRVVMQDSCARLKNATDIQEFYLGMKDEGVRGRRRWKVRKTWR